MKTFELIFKQNKTPKKRPGKWSIFEEKNGTTMNNLHYTIYGLLDHLKSSVAHTSLLVEEFKYSYFS